MIGQVAGTILAMGTGLTVLAMGWFALALVSPKYRESLQDFGAFLTEDLGPFLLALPYFLLIALPQLLWKAFLWLLKGALWVGSAAVLLVAPVAVFVGFLWLALVVLKFLWRHS